MLWDKWSIHRLAQVKELLRAQCAAAGLQPASPAEVGLLYHALGHAADRGIMPSFGDSGARLAYALDKLGGRAGRVAGVLLEADACFALCAGPNGGMEASQRIQWRIQVLHVGARGCE
jgi:hypothetical protein